jgi:hypothetical protein
MRLALQRGFQICVWVNSPRILQPWLSDERRFSLYLAVFIVNRAVMERQALNEEVERERNKIDRSHAGMRR